MDESVQTVKLLIVRLMAHIEENPDAANVERNKSDLAALTSLVSDAEEFHARNLPVDPDLGDVSHLPAELVKELTLSAPSELEQRIIAIINSCDDKTANINTILVELYNRHKVIQKRRNMNNKLWRMISNKLIWSVDGEKGVYTTIKPEEPAYKEPVQVDDEDPFADLNLSDDSSDTPIPF